MLNVVIDSFQILRLFLLQLLWVRLYLSRFSMHMTSWVADMASKSKSGQEKNSTEEA